MLFPDAPWIVRALRDVTAAPPLLNHGNNGAPKFPGDKLPSNRLPIRMVPFPNDLIRLHPRRNVQEVRLRHF